jgi:hypothetical protein
VVVERGSCAVHDSGCEVVQHGASVLLVQWLGGN